MNLYERKILIPLRKAMKSHEIIVLTGMRRVGKTSVLEILFNEIPDNKVFLDFENWLDRKIFEVKDYNRIIDGLKESGIKEVKGACVFIDELQNYPEAVKAMKYLYDHYHIRFVVTGSSSFYLKNLFPESLAGRKIIFELFPLDFEEFLTFKNQETKFETAFDKKSAKKTVIRHEKLNTYVQEYLEWGGFPQIVLAKNKEHKKRIIGDIFSSYYQKDIIQLSDFKNLNAFRDLLLLLIQRTGSKLDITKLASETGISRDTVYSYLYFLEATYMITLVKPFSLNPDREVSGARKVFFCDNGILNVFGKLSQGSEFENAVFCQLRKYRPINYYQKRTGQEIDFILPDHNTAIEVKLRGSSVDYRKALACATQLKIKNTFIVTHEYSNEKWCIPFNML
jgi:uncharacterized protein